MTFYIILHYMQDKSNIKISFDGCNVVIMYVTNGLNTCTCKKIILEQEVSRLSYMSIESV